MNFSKKKIIESLSFLDNNFNLSFLLFGPSKICLIRWGYPCLARVSQLALPGPPPPPASPHFNLRGLVFNFINNKFLPLFLFFCCGFFSVTKTFIDIDKRLESFFRTFLSVSDVKEKFDVLRNW